MRRLYCLWIASCLAMGLSACTAFRDWPADKYLDGKKKPDARPDLAQACADWRWIGISQLETRCPEVQGWTVRPLFPQLAPVRQASGGYCPEDDEKTADPGLIRELNRFCVYEIANTKQPLKDVPFPPDVSADLVDFDPDCAALALAEKYENVANGDVSEDVLSAQVGKPATRLETDHQLGVRLAFLDTQPTGVGVPEIQGNSPHGFTLAHLARKLVCSELPEEPEEQCAAQITTRLALPLIEFDPTNPKNNKIALTRGGYFGMQSHLAQAIRDEVDDWRRESPQQHLILNLSMAWDGSLFGGLKEEQVADLRAGTQAVYRALQYASRFDVLVLAAAGNQKREPCANYGPLLPAAWEGKALQDSSCQCRKSDPEKPLLYAVGGLRADREYLANARPGGMPQRAAFGETPLFAGSSVATAVASSIAAVVWNAFPDLSSRDVMEILDASVPETQLAYAADFGFDASRPAPRVQRLSLCTALEQACTRHKLSPCPFSLSCSRRKDKLEDLPFKVVAAKGSCAPWVRPQPEDNPCMACIKPPDVQ